MVEDSREKESYAKVRVMRKGYASNKYFLVLVRKMEQKEAASQCGKCLLLR